MTLNFTGALKYIKLLFCMHHSTVMPKLKGKKWAPPILIPHQTHSINPFSTAADLLHYGSGGSPCQPIPTCLHIRNYFGKGISSIHDISFISMMNAWNSCRFHNNKMYYERLAHAVCTHSKFLPFLLNCFWIIVISFSEEL